MTDMPPIPGALARRRLLRSAAGCLVPLLAPAAARAAVPAAAPGAAAGAAPGTAGAETFPNGARLLVAGPEGGRLDTLSAVLAAALERGLPPGTAVTRTMAGGTDGVTGANQFDNRTEPDGFTALIVPGAAALAWLTGDDRVHFDIAHWVPVMAGLYPGVVAGRLPAGGLAAGARIRLAASGPTGPDLAALLALELMGVPAWPDFAAQDAGAAREALRRGSVDLVFLHGSGVPGQVSALSAAQVQPLFTLGIPDQTGAFVRDPLFPDLPDMAEYCRRLRGAPPAGPLYAAWRGAATAAQLCFALVLPQFTPAALVALWRRAAAQAASAPAVQAIAASNAFCPLAMPAATGSTTAMAADAASLLELRRWLARRFDWHPG